jgi:hypothetical protein
MSPIGHGRSMMTQSDDSVDPTCQAVTPYSIPGLAATLAVFRAATNFSFHDHRLALRSSQAL